jgi:hypothetical protein
MLKEKLPFVLVNTFVLYIPLLALTHRHTHTQMEKQKHSLCVGWRNFFPFMLLCHFGSGEKKILVLLKYLEYITDVALC